LVEVSKYLQLISTGYAQKTNNFGQTVNDVKQSDWFRL